METDFLAATVNGSELLVEQIVASLKRLVEPNQVVELRALGVRQRNGRSVVKAGFFDDMREMTVAAAATTADAKGVYITMNPLKPDLRFFRKMRAVSLEKVDMLPSHGGT